MPSAFKPEMAEIKSKTCLLSFRCGVSEIESFAKKAFKKHSSETPNVRTRCLYDASNIELGALGFYSLSFNLPDRKMLDASSIYYGEQTFLYIDNLALRTEQTKKGYSAYLMVDLLESSNYVFQKFGGVHYLSLNAANKDAERFFSEKWGFTKIIDGSTPFMVMPRKDVQVTFSRITSVQANDSE